MRLSIGQGVTLSAGKLLEACLKLISYEEVRQKLGGNQGPCRRTIARMVKRGEFVTPVRASPRRVMFDEAEVLAWIEARKNHKTGVSR